MRQTGWYDRIKDFEELIAEGYDDSNDFSINAYYI